MPKYNYHCKNCEGSFSIYSSMNESRDNVSCEHCKSNEVYRVYTNILTKSSGFTKESMAPVTTSSKSSSGGCGSCSSSSCGTCH